MRMRLTPRVASAAVPTVGPAASPRAPRVRSSGAATADLLISGDVRMLVHAVRAVAEVAAVAVRIFYTGASHTNGL